MDLRIEAFGNGVSDRMKDVIEQALKVAFEHFSYGFKLRNPAANHSSIPEGKKLHSTLHIGALPKGIEELFGSPGTSGFELTTD